MNELQKSLTLVTAQVTGDRLLRMVKQIRADQPDPETGETKRTDNSYAMEIVEVMNLVHEVAQSIGHLGDAG